MTAYHLYQIRLDETQIAAINAGDRALNSDYMSARMGQISGAVRRQLHKFAAIVTASDLEDLFHKTNSIDQPWVQGPDVVMAVDNAASTSVGDIAVDAEANEAWLCASFGWEIMDWNRTERLLIDAKSISPPEEMSLSL